MAPKEKGIYTLIFVKTQTKILLGLKKRGFDTGKWNGFGGKVEDETIHQGALRELKEECGLSGKLRRIGVLQLDRREEGTTSIVHIFDTYTYNGDIKETEEMRPIWHNIKDIPFKEMRADAPYWFPLMLQGIFFKGYFLYQDEDTIIDYKVEQLKELDKT